MNNYGRIVSCGAMAGYDEVEAPRGPQGLSLAVATKRLRMEGFVVLDYVRNWAAAEKQLGGYVAAGQITVLEEVFHGLDSAPEALVGLLSGHNVGKRVVQVKA